MADGRKCSESDRAPDGARIESHGGMGRHCLESVTQKSLIGNEIWESLVVLVGKSTAEGGVLDLEGLDDEPQDEK